MKTRKKETDTKSRKVIWVGYCLECEKWRNNLHIITNVVTKQRRCSMCASVILIQCGSCDGQGFFGHEEHPCDECGGQRVVPQQKIKQRKDI